jgi:F-type H+-transporting ATPase subunit alpha
MRTLAEAVTGNLERARDVAARLSVEVSERQTGRVERVGTGVATVSGLAGMRLDEVLLFPGGERGLAVRLDPDRIGVMLLDRGPGIQAGAEVRGTGEVIRAPVGEALLGASSIPWVCPAMAAPPSPPSATIRSNAPPPASSSARS